MTSNSKGGISRRTVMQTAALAPLGLMTVSQALAQGVVPKRGGTLTTMITPEPPVLVLGVNNQGPTGIAAAKIYQGLVKFSPKLDPLPELAASWTLSDDRRTYTFKLQPNVKWHDGKPFTADDVVFSVMKFHMELSPRARTIFQKIQEAKIIDPLTVSFTLDAPFQPFLLMFQVTAAVMVPKHIYDGTDYRNNPANQTPIGTGPFRFVEWQRGNFIRVRRFDDYWKPGQPYLDEIIFRVIPDGQSRALAVQTGQAQLAAFNDIEPFDVPRLRELSNLEVTSRGWEYFSPLSWVELNHRVKPLDDVRVRQAMSHAIDRNFILNRLWFGVGKTANSPISSGTRFHDPSVKVQAFDPKAAIGLLDAAGLKPDSNGIRFSLRHMPLPYGEVWTRLSEYLRTAMRQVGIELKLESGDAGSWARRVGDWDYDTTVTYLNQFGDPTLGVERSYVSTNIQKVTFTNTGGYANPSVDALFAKARTAGEPADRAAAFSDVQKLLVTEAPQLWLLEMAFPTIYDKRLQNAVVNGEGIYSSYDDVFLV